MRGGFFQDRRVNRTFLEDIEQEARDLSDSALCEAYLETLIAVTRVYYQASSDVYVIGDTLGDFSSDYMEYLETRPMPTVSQEDSVEDQAAT